MSKQIDEKVNKLAEEFAEKLADLLIGVLESALAGTNVTATTPTPKPAPKNKKAAATAKEPTPQEAEPVEEPPEPDDIDDFFGDDGSDDEGGEDEGTEPVQEKLTFQDVSKVFFQRFKKIGDLVGADKAADVTRNVLKKYTGGKPLSRNTLPEEKYEEFLETVEGLYARAEELSKGGKNG